MANVLVTGGAGFIGSHIVTRMVELGHQVRVVDDLSSGKPDNLAHVPGGVDFVRGDLRHPTVCEQVCDGMDFVFHEAAVPSVPKSVDAPRPSHDVNITGTFNVLMAAAKCKVRRVIYAASSSAYGDQPESPKHEGMRTMPLSPYAVQKLAGEHYCKAFSECFGLQAVALRYFNVFGARQDPRSQYAAAIPAFVTRILRDESPIVYGDGEQTRDFTYIDNVVEGNVLAMKAERTAGEAVNLACGDQITVNHVIAEINGLVGKDIQPEYVDPRPGDIKHSCAAIGLAEELLGFKPVVSFREGLRRAIDYYRSLD